MRFYKIFVGFGLVMALIGCGGGGGSAGTPSGGTPSNPGTTPAKTAKLVMDVLGGAGKSTKSISAVEVAQVKVTALNAAGTPEAGVVVTFSEAGGGLLKFAPASNTAMTNSDGHAVIEVRAADQTKLGATTVQAAASVADAAITGTWTLEVTNAPTGGVVIDPQTLASAINFVSTDPADRSIVLAGAGGNGRTETGILTFRVVDKNNTPVKGVLVDFVVNPSSDVTLNITQAKTDADGSVFTSVSSKNVATSVVVKATVNGKSITTQSDQLKVTTGLGVQVGFEILPLLYTLDGALSGDSTDVTARLVDSNSNPVADGVPVVFQATGGKIATSDAGGCNTVNGACTVKFEVQNPRPASGIVTVTGSAKVGESTTLLRQIKLYMSPADIAVYQLAGGIPAAPLNPPAPVVLSSCNKKSLDYMIANTLGYTAPAGTTVSIKNDASTGLAATIDGGNIVPDGSEFGPTAFKVIFDPTAANNPSCNSSGIDIAVASVEVKTNAPKSKRESTVPISVSYPAGNLQLIKLGTASTPAAINVGACGSSEDTEVQAIGSDGLTLPAGARFSAIASDSTATVTVSTVKPPATSDILPAASNNANRQSLWFSVTAPSAGAARCSTAGTVVSKSFTVDVTVLIGTKRNTQTLTVTYPGN